MACPICAQGHDIFNCLTFATTAQNLKDLLKDIHAGLPNITTKTSTYNKVYDNFYAPGQGLPRWTFWYSPMVASQDIPLMISERVYLNVIPFRLNDVWQGLVQEFERAPSDVIQGKRCSEHDAVTRYDTVVIYLRNKAAVWRLLDRIRARWSPLKTGTVGNARSPFRSMVPPGTGMIPDLPGVAVASQPENASDSFGSLLCGMIADTWDKECKPIPIPLWDFVGITLRNIRDGGLDLKRPWNIPAKAIEAYPLGFAQKH
jgi:hypothetical protein